MAPRSSRKAKATETAAPLSLSPSPRRTRSGAAVGKRVAPPLAVRAKSRKKKEERETATATATADAKSIVIIIEACKQCNAFKTRALKVKEGLESALPSVSVVINPQKPRRGCFEIRQEAGQIFVSLLNMPRPFTPMKKLDMDELVKDIINKIH